MHRSSLVRRPLGLLLGLALLASPPLGGAARAADKSTKVTFDTKDGVTLQGTFYPSPKGKDEPTVLLLHKVGGESHKDGWDGLADKLNEKGYSVLSFDLRGHGASTEVEGKKFWSYPWNDKYIKGDKRDPKTGKLKDSISQKDFLPGYLPYLVNDVAAAKLFLDDRNDAGECNSRALILIGAEDGATLGAMWMASDWSRFSATVTANPINPRLPPRITDVSTDSEGKDQYCGIWLSMTPSVGKTSVHAALKNWLVLAGRDKKVPMAFVYGGKDEKGETNAKEFLKIVKPTDKEKDTLKFTDVKMIADTNLTGSALLRGELKTSEWIVDKYLPLLREKNVPHKWSKIDLDRTGYVWVFNNRPVVAKDEKSKVLECIPLGPLGITNP